MLNGDCVFEPALQRKSRAKSAEWLVTPRSEAAFRQPIAVKRNAHVAQKTTPTHA
jgi:hypothetical protein